MPPAEIPTGLTPVPVSLGTKIMLLTKDAATLMSAQKIQSFVELMPSALIPRGLTTVLVC
jgi:hypothetical protein